MNFCILQIETIEDFETLTLLLELKNLEKTYKIFFCNQNVTFWNVFDCTWTNWDP